MSENASDDSPEVKPVIVHKEDVIFPPFPDPTEGDFDDDITEDERNYYKEKYKDLTIVKTQRLHCTACDRHLGCAARNESRMRSHPMLRTLVCHSCHNFYNSGEFEKGDDGSELYCRWCGQGGQVYCCSDCPHVFCARCIRRNLGTPKIKEIEQTDDWKCFKCNSKCLWDIRATCWAVLRYCDQKNKITYNTEDPEKKDLFQKDCAVDYTECCKNKNKKKDFRKKESENTPKISTASIISKISPAIQVKKLTTIVPEEKPDMKPLKRPASPKQRSIVIKNAIPVSGPSKSPVTNHNAKKIRMTPPSLISTSSFSNEKKINPTYASHARFKATNLPIPIYPNYNGSFNNYSNIVSNDNINLSLDNLTQGLDMTAVAAMSTTNQDDDVVCTPDLPLETMYEVREDNADDDVQCITPGPIVTAKVTPVPQLVARTGIPVPELIPENIVHMTENDVIVNRSTGGLKFRVDPLSLSSNKMYQLPDGRIFAISSNNRTPGGYSATIVAHSDSAGKRVSKGATFAAKLRAVTTAPKATTPPSPVKSFSSRNARVDKKCKIDIMHTSVTSGIGKRVSETSGRQCDLNVPIEWYRYNLIDAVDALEYSLSRLHKLKREATTVYLRTRTVNEMRNLHRTLDRLLITSVNRFNEVRHNVNKEMRLYVTKKLAAINKAADNTSEDDDDVEILPDLDDNDDDPIFIDENSSDPNDDQEVDLTGANSDYSPDKSAKRKNSDTTKICHDNNDDSSGDAVNASHDDKDGEDEEGKNETSVDVDHLKSAANKKKGINGKLDGQSDCKSVEHKDDDHMDHNRSEQINSAANNSETSGGEEYLEQNSGNEGTGTACDTEKANAGEKLRKS